MCGHIEDNAYRFWWGKTTLGRLRRRWEDNIKMDLTEMAWEGVIWLRMLTNGRLL
jgi:hypothetical protein